MAKSENEKQKKWWHEIQRKYSTASPSRFDDNITGILSAARIFEKIGKTYVSCPAYPILEGVAMTNSNIMILEHHKIVLRKDHLMMDKKVKLVTGGKTGHEPLFLSYLGPGMLTGAIVGSDISAPSSSDIFICFKELSYNHNAGIIAIVPNSFEEVINFGLGIEKARCNGILVDMVTIGDDCWESGKLRFGRRCLAGIVLAFKIAGAMAEDNKSMKDIYLTLRQLCIGTISCHLLQTAFIGTDLDAGTGMYFPIVNMCEIIKVMLDYLVDPKKYFSLPMDSDSSYVLMINSYTCERLFLYACVKEVLEQLSYREINIVRVYAGTFVSGNRGFSITLLNVEENIKLLRYTDSACSCQFWPRIDARGVPLIVKGPSMATGQQPLFPMGPFIKNKEFIDIPLKFACKALISSENVLNQIDVNHSFGTSLIPAIKTIMERCNEKEFPKSRPYNLLNVIAYICQDHISNINGTLLYIFFLGAAQAFLSYSREVSIRSKMWIEALIRGVDSIKAYTQINENDFTIFSVLAPFTCTLKFHYLQNQLTDVETMMDDAIRITNKLMNDTYEVEAPRKQKGMPEVTGQAALVCLTALVEGIRFVIHKTKGIGKGPEDIDMSSCDEVSDKNKN